MHTNTHTHTHAYVCCMKEILEKNQLNAFLPYVWLVYTPKGARGFAAFGVLLQNSYGRSPVLEMSVRVFRLSNEEDSKKNIKRREVTFMCTKGQTKKTPRKILDEEKSLSCLQKNKRLKTEDSTKNIRRREVTCMCTKD